MVYTKHNNTDGTPPELRREGRDMRFVCVDSQTVSEGSFELGGTGYSQKNVAVLLRFHPKFCAS